MSKIDLHKGDCLHIMDELITKGVVVDAIITDLPYGTTAVACKNTNRNFYACELEPDYCEIANKRLKAVQGSLLWQHHQKTDKDTL